MHACFNATKAGIACFHVDTDVLLQSLIAQLTLPQDHGEDDEEQPVLETVDEHVESISVSLSSD
jgi:hypothetical protein